MNGTRTKHSPHHCEAPAREQCGESVCEHCGIIFHALEKNELCDPREPHGERHHAAEQGTFRRDLPASDDLIADLGNRGALGYGGRVALVALVAIVGDSIDSISNLIRRALGNE